MSSEKKTTGIFKHLFGKSKFAKQNDVCNKSLRNYSTVDDDFNIFRVCL